MFAKLSAVALLAAPLAAALTLNAPTEPTSSGEVTITWDFEPSDPLFTIELTHPSFNDKLAIANNVDPAQGSVTFVLPAVPAQSGYTLEAVNVGDINEVYSTTGAFAIAPNPNTTFSASSTASSAVASSGSAGASVTRSTSAAASSPSTRASGSATSGSQSSSASPADVTNLAGEDGAASTSVISSLGVLAAAVAGALVL
ncbi:hypothetical protein BKA70DRAFT_1398720 [Coprinopsis sp. MPI-PUGE-AT-0042]|nr:hypothetical protein BKA70DRAFT_1398720 [Coprinopsis sp. MPI-PUGE-AT-0042]